MSDMFFVTSVGIAITANLDSEAQAVEAKRELAELGYTDLAIEVISIEEAYGHDFDPILF